MPEECPKVHYSYPSEPFLLEGLLIPLHSLHNLFKDCLFSLLRFRGYCAELFGQSGRHEEQIEDISCSGQFDYLVAEVHSAFHQAALMLEDGHGRQCLSS